MNLILRAMANSLLCLLITFPVCSWAREDGSVMEASQIAAEGKSVSDFVPPGWVIEEQVSGDLNKDSLPDVALILIEEKPVKDADTSDGRQRALVILFRDKDGKFSRVVVAARLLQCTRCGGAFYGMVDAPAHVRIDNGVLIVNQDHGSRNVVEITFRFRYDPSHKKFVLIGLDKEDRDRMAGTMVSESINFLTGMQITRRSRFSDRKEDYVIESTVKKKVPRKTVFIEDVNHEQY